jgi:DNA modification methylase
VKIRKKTPRQPQTAYEGDAVALARKAGKDYHLVIADPPYNFGQPYEAYVDNKSYEEYMAWTREWLHVVVSVLDKNGTLWVFAPDEWVSEIDMMCRHELKLYKRNHVIWAFTFGQKAQRRFTRAHCHILYFTKTKTQFTFNEDAVKVPSARQLVYNDKRAVAGGKPPDDVWMLLRAQLEPYMTPDKDTWLVSRVCGTFREREKHSPNQIPVPVMERIVVSTSNPGDAVLDPFCGTGASGVACARNGRDWLGYDVSKTCVEQSNRRIREG